MVAISAGCYLMGDPRGYSDDRPRHRVCLEAFRIDRFEVTVAAYGKCVAAGRCGQPISHAPRHLTSRHCNWKRAGRERHPINCVTWDQAVAYCAWLGRRLPTEAEWERAAQGVKILGSPGAVPTCDHAVIALSQGNRLAPGCGTGDTLPIGARPRDRSAAGARDLLGSVSEWTADWFELRYYKRSLVDRPQGPRTGRARVVRGGSFRTPPGSRLLRITARQFSGSWDPTIGFRCAAGGVILEPRPQGGAP